MTDAPALLPDDFRVMVAATVCDGMETVLDEGCNVQTRETAAEFLRDWADKLSPRAPRPCVELEVFTEELIDKSSVPPGFTSRSYIREILAHLYSAGHLSRGVDISGEWIPIEQFPDSSLDFRQQYGTHECFFYNDCNGPYHQSFWADDGFREKYIKGWTHFMPVHFKNPAPPTDRGS